MNGRRLAILVVLAAALAVLWWTRRAELAAAELAAAAAAAAKAQLRREARDALAREREAAMRDPELVRHLVAAVDEFTASPEKWATVVDVGDMYARGDYPLFRPDAQMALRCYSAAMRCPDALVAASARSKFAESRLDATDIAGARMPRSPGETLLRVAARNTTRTCPPLPAVNEVPLDTDMQNVHDHSVTAAMRKTLEQLKARGDAADATIAVTDAILQCDMDGLEKARALQVVDSLDAENEHFGGVSESGALDLVWAHILAQDHPEIRSNLTETLVKQLASGVEKGHTVCSTGKVARIVGTLDGSMEHTLKPMWAVRHELGTLAARVRDDVLGSASHDEHVRYEAGENEALETTMKTTFESSALALYCDDLGMSRAVMLPLIHTFAEWF